MRSTTTISLKSYLKFMGQWHNECKVIPMLNIRPEVLTVVKVRISELACRYSLSDISYLSWIDLGYELPKSDRSRGFTLLLMVSVLLYTSYINRNRRRRM